MPRSKEQSEQIRAASRQQILSTARRLFSEQGYDFCQVSDIARQADMSHGNIYWYFPSKEEILKAVLAESFETLHVMFAEVAARPGAGVEKLDTLIDRFIVFGRGQGGEDFLNILLTLTAKGGVERLSKLGFDMPQIGVGWHQPINAIFAQAQAEGQVTQGIAPDLLTTFFLSFFSGLMRTYSREWKDIPTEALHQAVFRLTGVKTA